MALASVGVSLLVKAAPVIFPVIRGIVKQVQAALGPKTGAAKMELATKWADAAMDALVGTGKLAERPSAELLTVIIEAVLQALKSSGEIDGKANVEAVRSEPKPEAVTMPIPDGARLTIEF